MLRDCEAALIFIMLVIMWGHREGEKKREKLSACEGNVRLACPAVAVREHDVLEVLKRPRMNEARTLTKVREKTRKKKNVTNHPTFGLFWRFLPAATQNKTPGINTYFPTKVSVWILVVFCFFKWNLRSSPSFFTHQTEPVESQRGGVHKTDELLIVVTLKYSAHLFFNPVSPETPSSQLVLGGWLLSIVLQLCSEADSFHFYWHFNEL